VIIVLSGVRGSGKDTIGDILVRNHGFRKESFAEPLKRMVKEAFPAFTGEDLYGPSRNREREYPQYPLSECPYCGGKIEERRYHVSPEGAYIPGKGGVWCTANEAHGPLPRSVTPRIALQTLGTEWGRRLYKDVWVDACFSRIRRSEQDRGVKDNWVITDCRFLNEVQGSRRNGGVVVRLTRNLRSSTDDHASEAEIRTIPDSEYSLVFDNEPLAVEELPDQVATLLGRV